MSGQLRVRRIGIDTRHEHIVYMHSGCDVCRSEGFQALNRVVIRYNGSSIIGTINSVHNHILEVGEVGLSESAWESLGAPVDALVHIEHVSPVDSFSHVRAKLYGHHLSHSDFTSIVDDIYNERYSNTQLAAFIASGVGDRLDVDEVISLTKSMVHVGQRLHWNKDLVVDKHCIGGLPGNRTTPIVVAIIAAAGLTIPKTSSRAITSPSGTADCMEVLTTVQLSQDQIRRVVDSEGGCLAWGGAVNLSPIDDILIRVERTLDLDSEGQLVASVLSKKAAAGSTHVLIDIPVGPTAKMRSEAAAEALRALMEAVAGALGLTLQVLFTDGRQPIGRGIGPALEARDVLQVLRNEPVAPSRLRNKSLLLAEALLKMAGKDPAEAKDLLTSGKAFEKFRAICIAQGGYREPALAPHFYEVTADVSGEVTATDNRRIARVAKLAGAPHDKAAGIDLFISLGDRIQKGQPLYRIYSESEGELAYAVNYLHSHPSLITLTS